MHPPSTNPEQDKKKQLLQKYLQKLIEKDSNLFYASTTEIAHNLHPLLKEHLNRMSVEDQLLLRDLTVRDIEMLLSFH
ncbi:hypothetical protein [Psychrobacter lutiphocae]|uniref:hypothetical protein n=1 Tax=Psychrobacter lutiphocae TaxID=540500 RepID=UPI00037DE8B3|nr:hypothetical protein [Psychrobacter lutiphocae]